MTISHEDARQMQALYKACMLADIHYHSCQAPLAWRYVRETYKAPGIAGAFERLSRQLEQQEHETEG